MKQKEKKNGTRLQLLLVPETKLMDAMELYPGKNRVEVRGILYRELRKKLLPGVGMALIFLILALLLLGKEEESKGIRRPAPGTVAVSHQVLLETESGWKNFSLPIGALEYEDAQIEVMHEAAVRYLEQIVPGENQGFDKVTKDLFFPASLPETGGEISWSTDAPWYVNSKGEVLNEELKEPVEVEIKAKIAYGSEYRYFSKVIRVCPTEYCGEEAVLHQVQQELISQEEATRTSEWFYLPERVLGYSVEKAEESGGSVSGFLVLLALVVPLLLYSGYFGSIDTRRKEWKEQAERCYMEFITKLSLLLAAGISLRQAFLRLAEEYETRYGQKHVLAAELRVAKQELDNGHSEAEVYEAFGRRIGVLAYRRMASLLVQNVSRGVQGMRTLLLQEAKDVMAQDKANIRMRGEQAGTKLLFPMMGLLFLVFAILLMPAFQSF